MCGWTHHRRESISTLPPLAVSKSKYNDMCHNHRSPRRRSRHARRHQPRLSVHFRPCTRHPEVHTPYPSPTTASASHSRPCRQWRPSRRHHRRRRRLAQTPQRLSWGYTLLLLLHHHHRRRLRRRRRCCRLLRLRRLRLLRMVEHFQHVGCRQARVHQHHRRLPGHLC
eukprot:COSAG01_NODE_2834_length_6995_cov_5.819751_8_plen_168_part_00